MTKRFSMRLTALAAMLACLPASAADVVISQAYGGGGNSGAPLKYDFVELFNRGANPVSLNGWTIQYAGATGSSWSKVALNNVSLQPGQYYLVKLLGSTNGEDFTSDQSPGGINMSGTTGKVALVSNNVALTGAAPVGAEIQDFIGWGSGATAFEGAYAPATTNPTALWRADGGCTDTDNNAADFTVAAPAPRTMAAPLNVCGAPVVKPIVASCPSEMRVAVGVGGGVVLGASDDDGIVNAASITSPAVAGLMLENLTVAGSEGASANVTLSALASVPLGTYPVTIAFGNNQGQTASCNVTVKVETPAPITHSIPQIQGAGATSPYNNTVQTAEGVVTAKVGTGYFMQDVHGDGDPTTSDGIFVYMGSNTTTSAAVGDLVRVTGTVTEFTPSGAARSYTEFKDSTSLVTGRGYSVAPINVELLSTNLADVEGMLVRFTNKLTINQSEYLASRGELTLAVGRREIPTNRYPARSAEAQALAAANASNVLTLDDGIFVTPSTIPYLGDDGTVRVGDTISDLTGVIDYGSVGGGSPGFKLQPTVAPMIFRENPRELPPVLAHGNVKVASANVLNFFTTFTDGTDAWGGTGKGCTIGLSTSKGNCRGADNMSEFVRQRDKIVAELKEIDADVVGLMEIQNDGDTSVNYLVGALNAAYGEIVYAAVPKPAATGTDAIRVAMIYKPAKLTLAGASLSDADSINNRPPMAQTFKAANGGKFSLIVNHLKSKGSCSTSPSTDPLDKDLGDSQSCWNATRVKQAQRLVGSFVPQVVAAAGDPDVLMIGDFNAYGMEDPIMTIVAAGFENQLERFVRPVAMPHSYVFGGESGYLDHALASTALSAQVLGAAEWNVNADEPSITDYNLDGKTQQAKDLYNTLPYRASDHDPVVISLDIAAPYMDVTSSLKVQRTALLLNPVTRKSTGTVWLTNVSNAPLAGPLHYLIEGLPQGVTLDNAAGYLNGVPYITVNGPLAVGSQVSFGLQFSNPARVGIAYTPKVLNGNF